MGEIAILSAITLTPPALVGAVLLWLYQRKSVVALAHLVGWLVVRAFTRFEAIPRLLMWVIALAPLAVGFAEFIGLTIPSSSAWHGLRLWLFVTFAATAALSIVCVYADHFFSDWHNSGEMGSKRGDENYGR